MLIAGQHLLLRRQLGEKTEPFEAVGSDSITVNDHSRLRSWRRSSQSKFLPSLNFCMSAWDPNYRAPAKLQHHKAANEGLIKRPCGKHAEVVDVARFVSLIASTEFFSDDLGGGRGRRRLLARRAIA